MKRKPLKDLKVKSNMQFVYYDYESKEVIRIDAWGELAGRHNTSDKKSTMFLVNWLAIYSENENVQFIFLNGKEELKEINFRA